MDVPLASASADAHDDESGAVASKNEPTPPEIIQSVSGELDCSTPQPAKKLLSRFSGGVSDWNPEEDDIATSDSSKAPQAPSQTPVEQLPTPEVARIPAGPATKLEQAEQTATPPVSVDQPCADQRRLLSQIAFPEPQPAKPSEASVPVLDHAERQQLTGKLRALGLWEHGLRRIFALRTAPEIRSGLAELAANADDVERPAAWIYAHLVNHWDDMQEAKAEAAKTAAAQAAAASCELSEAERVRAQERERNYRPALEISNAEREAMAQARRLREAEQEHLDSLRRDEQTRASIAILETLPTSELAELRRRAQETFRGRTMPEGIIRGQMLAFLEADRH